MKKNAITLLLLGIIVTFIADSVTAQNINAAKVPASVKQSFVKAFPGITAAKWELEDNKYKAGFKQQGKIMSALIDAQGNLLETETDIAVTELPAPITNYLSLHYKAAKIKEAAIIKKATGEIVYEAEINHKDLLFNAEGKPIK